MGGSHNFLPHICTQKIWVPPGTGIVNCHLVSHISMVGNSKCTPHFKLVPSQYIDTHTFLNWNLTFSCVCSICCFCCENPTWCDVYSFQFMWAWIWKLFIYKKFLMTCTSWMKWIWDLHFGFVRKLLNFWPDTKTLVCPGLFFDTDFSCMRHKRK